MRAGQELPGLTLAAYVALYLDRKTPELGWSELKELKSLFKELNELRKSERRPESERDGGLGLQELGPLCGRTAASRDAAAAENGSVPTRFA
jgi:hypothetical protein